MPELPEVETTRRGIASAITGRQIAGLQLRERRLRWPVPAIMSARLTGARLDSVERRAKYLLLNTERGTALLHLGMSGSLRLCPKDEEPGLHDHFDLLFDGKLLLRFNDPRRFGSFLWAGRAPEKHRLIRNLGPEPLGDSFSGEYLYSISRGRRLAIQSFIMNGTVVVGVGNIYASESLYRSGIHPRRQAGRISLARMNTLADSIREVLSQAIHAGGTTLRDFYGGDGQPGYFQRELLVYGRGNEPCEKCGGPIREALVAQRSTFWCPQCQR